MDLQFSAEVWYWRGPAPYHFLTVPDEASAALESASDLVSYGWGMIPVTAIIGSTTFTTSLWPKNGYIVPLKKAVRVAQDIELGDVVAIRMTVEV